MLVCVRKVDADAGLTGEDNFCRAPGCEVYGQANLHQGSFGSHVVFDESWLFKIPAGVRPEHAAPLMCGGATVFEIMQTYVRPTDRVGIIGLGGLGHMAVQFLVKIKEYIEDPQRMLL